MTQALLQIVCRDDRNGSDVFSWRYKMIRDRPDRLARFPIGWNAEGIGLIGPAEIVKWRSSKAPGGGGIGGYPLRGIAGGEQVVI